ncbi:YoaK family protein [soil metagenome]
MSEKSIPSSDSKAVLVLLFILSVVAGTTDVIGFLGLNGLFTAHITGNLVLLCAQLVGYGDAQLAKILSIPVFIVVVGMTRVLAGRLALKGIESLCPLLWLQFILIAGFFALCLMAGPIVNPNTTITIVAGMFGVSAMAVQNALVQLSIKDAPSTAIMTSNVTRFALDIGTVMLNANQEAVDHARKRAGRTLPVILGFAIGCGIGALSEKTFGLTSLALPTVLTLVLVVLGIMIERDMVSKIKREL